MGKYLNNRQNRRPKRQSVLRQTINFVGKKAKLIFLVLLLIFFFRVPNIQAQSAGGGWLIDTTIIPIINYGLWWGYTDNNIYPGAMDSMKAVVDGMNLDLGLKDGVPYSTIDNMMNTLKGYGFHVLPQAVYNITTQTMYNWVNYYTDAKYMDWEVEGTAGDTAYLRHDENIMTETTDGDTTYIELKPDKAQGEKTLMWGPYYSQNVGEYTQSYNTTDTARYTAVFWMKLKNNIPEYQDSTYSDNPTTPICVIQVTQSYPVTDTHPWHLGGTYVIKQDTITLNEFEPLNYFYNFPLLPYYTLWSDSCQSAPGGPGLPVHDLDNAINNNGVSILQQRNYIQFKVKWLGNPNYRLSIDKVTVYDDKGYRLIVSDSTNSKNQIISELNQLSGYDSTILGWLGRDEPNSIDEYAPIKKVLQIIKDYTNNNQRPLWLTMMGKSFGLFNQANDPFGTYHLSPWKEMKKRIGDDMNVWQDAYYFDSPYCDTCAHTKPDWKSEDIKVAAELNYKQAYDLDPNFGISIQCGNIKNATSLVSPNQLLYETNLALMYGAKFLSLYVYFARQDSDYAGWGSHAIVNKLGNQLIYTPKYTLLRYKIKPRLTGLFGKTLKKLVVTLDTLDNYLGNLNLSYIKSLFINGNPSTSNYLFDIGLFKDPAVGDNGNEKRFFMLLNRYYMEIPQENLSDNFTLTIKDMNYYHNWKFIDYRDTTSYTLVPEADGTKEIDNLNIPLGDASFIQISPVIKYGGDMVVNDTIGGTISLNDTDLVINNGATLLVEGTYDCYKDIILKDGSSITSVDQSYNPIINMHNGHKIIVEGNTTISGNANCILPIDFISSSGNGIVVDSGGSLTVSYCNVKNATNGIFASNHSAHLDISYCTFTNCDTTSIFINSFGNSGGGLGPSAPSIHDNTITGGYFGISVSNSSNLIIQDNMITNTDEAIYFSQVSNSQIVENTITSNKETLPGIFFNSSNGNIRLNTIDGHSNGIYLANSSPTIGNNFISGNKYHGLYVSTNSNPDLSADLVQIPGTQPPQFYGYSGYNEIYENGVYMPGSDGSEIYLSYASIILNKPAGDGDIGSGCNSIYDDRMTPDSTAQLLLINGEGIRDTIDGRNQYWGQRGVYPARFGIPVIYMPYNDGCPMPTQPSGSGLMVSNFSGGTVDTLYPVSEYSGTLTNTEQQYALAENYFITDSLNQANQIYSQIVSNDPNGQSSLKAYVRLFTIKKLQSGTVNDFIQLRNTLLQNLNNMTDSLMIGVINHLTNLCLVSQQQYTAAIDSFNTIIQQFPNTDQALFASIDILITSLLVHNGGNQLGKRIAKEYIANSSVDYQSKLLNLMQSKFGNVKTTSGNETIPKEYKLYHNYPNPFNPTTTIKYDISKVSRVTIKIYDILGREVRTLLDNELKNPGSYNVVFNAGHLASGVYLYRLQADDYVNVKKMILLK